MIFLKNPTGKLKEWEYLNNRNKVLAMHSRFTMLQVAIRIVQNVFEPG